MSRYRTPTVGAIARIGDGEEYGIVLLGDCGDEHETAALVIPQTREAYDQLYDRLVTAFSNRADRYDIASMALAEIGVETQTQVRRTA